jgi:ABC-type multidrug transport system fused ATPase/permease subunit
MIEEEKLEGKNNFSFEKELTFEEISFAYTNGTLVLDEISLSVRKGEMTSIIGPSGAGKTTIFDLILRLLSPQQGKIIIDGVNISTIGLKEWRKNIGYVPQDIFLISSSIKNNIRFYNPHVSDEEIIEAARQANILEFIENLPQGFDTEVGERGVKLSGGQRQRIIIARALARKPKLLLLDEATSALDAESEKEIQRAIESLKGRLTIMVIAHRLSTVSKSDTIIAVDNGRVIEQGSPDDLLANPQSYFSKVQANDFI